jgi:hypothetical protein
VRPRTLSTRGMWAAVRTPVVRPILADHNSIQTAGVRYGAAKQAAPPRGVPR